MNTVNEMLDAPSANLPDYIEDVLPAFPEAEDVQAALTKRGFSAIDPGGGLQMTWTRPVRDGKSGYLSLFGQKGVVTLDFCPKGLERVRRTGNLRAMLREADRMIATFEPPGWEQFRVDSAA